MVEPIDGENNDAYGPSFLRWQNRNLVVYQDHTAWRGGNVKYVEVDSELNPLGSKHERDVLLDPSPDPPLKDRYRGGAFYLDNDTIVMFPLVVQNDTPSQSTTPCSSYAAAESSLHRLRPPLYLCATARTGKIRTAPGCQPQMAASIHCRCG